GREADHGPHPLAAEGVPHRRLERPQLRRQGQLVEVGLDQLAQLFRRAGHRASPPAPPAPRSRRRASPAGAPPPPRARARPAPAGSRSPRRDPASRRAAPAQPPAARAAPPLARAPPPSSYPLRRRQSRH